MKKLLLTTFLAFGFFATAQTIDFGVKGGINFSNFNGSIVGVSTNNLTNFHFGFVTEFHLFENFSIQPELLYITKGAELKGFDEQVKNELGYLALPILAKFYLTENGLSLEAGPQFSFLVNERNEIADGAKKMDLGIVGGLGYQLTDNIFVQARYVAGLTKVYDGDTAGGTIDLKHSVIMLSAGIKF
jgi:opacity protein-like surface antigen